MPTAEPAAAKTAPKAAAPAKVVRSDRAPILSAATFPQYQPHEFYSPLYNAWAEAHQRAYGSTYSQRALRRYSPVEPTDYTRAHGSYGSYQSATPEWRLE
jgi:hypothetical protein